MNPAEESRRPLVNGLLVTGLCLLTLAIQAPGLAHPFMPNWDESLHQTATRGTYDSFFRPHLYADPLHETPPNDYPIRGGVWLHKPAGPLWLGALMMHLVGVKPLALRLVSLLADLLITVCLFRYALPIVGRFSAMLAPVLYITLPFLWRLTQGWQFGDVTDTTLAAGNMLGILLLLKTIEAPSLALAASTGAVIGATFLCKNMLALTPLGVAAGLAGFGSLGLCRGLRWRDLLAVWGTALLVGGPWNLYCFWRFPKEFDAEVGHTFRHLDAVASDISMWHRPMDAIFNEIHRGELKPYPLALPIVAFLWLFIRGIRRREPRIIALFLWIAASWYVLTLASGKVPNVVWGVVPAVMIGVAVLVHDAVGSWPLALTLTAPFLTEPAIRAMPQLGQVRSLFPVSFVETRSQPGLAEGLCLAAAGALAGALLGAALRALHASKRISVLATAAVLFITGGVVLRDLAAVDEAQRTEFKTQEFWSFSSELGPVLAKTLPTNGFLAVAVSHEPQYTFLYLDLMFWSGRMAYINPTADLLRKGRERGYHPYLVTTSAEPYAPIEGIPSDAWLRAYDLDKPAPNAPLPAGLERVDQTIGGTTILGIASGDIDASHDRYTIYASGEPRMPKVSFHLKGGVVVNGTPGENLARPEGLRTKPWFILPMLGPPRASVEQITFGS